MTPKDKLHKARTGLILDAPFFGSLALRLEIRPEPGCGTAAVDGRSLVFEPTFVDGLTLEQTKGLFAHEVMHCALNHHTRRAGRDWSDWQIATDRVVNAQVIAAGFVLPTTDHVRPEPGDDTRSVDEIYAQIQSRKPKPDPQGQQNTPQQGQGQGQGKGNSQGTGQGQGQDAKAPQASPDAAGRGKSSPAPGEKGNQPDPGKCGAVRDYEKPEGAGAATPADRKAEEAMWKQALQQATQTAKVMGRLPAGIARLTKAELEPKVSWRDALAQWLQAHGRNDYSWSTPSRRYAAAGLYLPALRSPELPPIVIAVDTSGSIDNQALATFAAEISGILQAFDCTLHVVYCDTEINPDRAQELHRSDLPLELQAEGGGGTDFRPPFAWVDEKALQPAGLIYLTDLRCSRYPAAPDYPVLWAAYGAGSYSTTPPFGDVIQIEEHRYPEE